MISPSQSPRAISDRRILLNLIRQEWRLCRGQVIPLATVWLVGLWVLVIFHHPAWLIAIGLWHCFTISPTQAGRDVFDGTEEFSFSLPPGRSPLYLARVSPGLVFLLANGLLGGLAIACNLPQRLWALVFSGGLTEPFAPVADGRWYAAAVLLPCAAHAATFALAANAGSRAKVNASWLTGFFTAVSVMAVGLGLEKILWQETNGLIAGPALVLATVLFLLGGHHAYLRKQATASGGVAGKDAFPGTSWIIACVLGLVLFSVICYLWLFRTAVKSETHQQIQAQEQAMRAEEMQARERTRNARANPLRTSMPPPGSALK